MIQVKDASSFLDLDVTTIKRDLKANFDGKYERVSGTKNGMIVIPAHTMREMLEKREKTYKHQKVTIAQEKGGVGKTTLTLQVAIRKAKLGCRVLVIDLDPEANSTIFLMREEDEDKMHEMNSIYEVFKENLKIEDCILPSRYEFVDYLPAQGRMRKVDRLTSDGNPKKLLRDRLQGLEEKYDLILFDLPPTFTRIVASAYLASDLVILPCTPSNFSVEGLGLTMGDLEEDAEDFDAEMPEVKILINMFRHNRKASMDIRSVLASNYGDKLLPFCVKESAEIQNIVNENESIYDVRISPDLRSNFDELAHFVCPLTDKVTLH